MTEGAPLVQGRDAGGLRHTLLTTTGALGTTQTLIVNSTSTTPVVNELDYPGVAAAGRVVSTVATRPIGIRGRNVNAAVRFLMIFDAAAVPGVGATPDHHPMEIPAGAEFGDTWPEVEFTVGLVWAVSTTDVTLTISGTNDFLAETYHRTT